MNVKRDSETFAAATSLHQSKLLIILHSILICIKKLVEKKTINNTFISFKELNLIV